MTVGGKPGPQKKVPGVYVMTEREFQDKVLKYAQYLGLLCYHTHDSRRSQAGFPDLVIVGKRTIFAELKSERGKLSNPQREWLLRLRDSGQEVYVWRPDDWPTVQDVLLSVQGRTINA